MTGRAKRRLFVWTANAVCVCVAILLISALFLTSARWSGRFMLRINVKLPPAIERDSLMYMPCRDKQTAEWLCRPGNQVTEGFELPYQRTADYDVVSVSIGGKSSVLRIFDTYHQPDSVVLQYDQETKSGLKDSCRIHFPVPMGRGDRSVSIDLTQADK
ncbi:MAG: hypothetical protein CMM00_14175 [Rhodopirellula sp.]|nr:hypothetical protein [Rhodopirellula sp.]